MIEGRLYVIAYVMPCGRMDPRCAVGQVVICFPSGISLYVEPWQARYVFSLCVDKTPEEGTT